MIEVNNIDATIISRDLNKLKADIIKDPNFLDSIEDKLDIIRSETHANVINGHNFRRSFKVLRNLIHSSKNVVLTKQIKSDKLIDIFLKNINPMLTALNGYVLDKPTTEELEQIRLTDARNRLWAIDRANLSDDEMFEEYDDYEEDTDLLDEEQMEKAISKLTKGDKSLPELEKKLRLGLFSGIKKDKVKQERLTLDVDSLLKKNNFQPQVKQKEDTGNKPFSELSKLLEIKAKENPKSKATKKEDLKALVLKEGIQVIEKLDAKQRKELFKLLPKENKELMVNSDDFLVEQLNALGTYKIEDYDIPTLEEDEDFKLFTAPIFAVTSPYLSSKALSHVSNLKSRLVFPGWLLENQVVATIKRSTYKSKSYPKVVNTILSMLKSRTKQYWTHASNDCEFTLKGFNKQVFLWFVPSDFTQHTGTFAVDEISFPFYMRRQQKANASELKQIREQRVKDVESLLFPYYNKVDKMYELADKFENSYNEVITNLAEKRKLLEDLNSSSFDMTVILENRAKKKQYEELIDNLEVNSEELKDKAELYTLRANQWSKKLAKLNKTLCQSNSPLADVDLTYFKETEL